MSTTLRVTQRIWFYARIPRSGVISIFAFLCLLVNCSLKVLYFSKGIFWNDDEVFCAKISNGSIMKVWQGSNYSQSLSSVELNFLPFFVYVSVTIKQLYNKD